MVWLEFKASRGAGGFTVKEREREYYPQDGDSCAREKRPLQKGPAQPPSRRIQETIGRGCPVRLQSDLNSQNNLFLSLVMTICFCYKSMTYICLSLISGLLQPCELHSSPYVHHMTNRTSWIPKWDTLNTREITQMGHIEYFSTQCGN